VHLHLIFVEYEYDQNQMAIWVHLREIIRLRIVGIEIVSW